jgi:L-ascorbate metabolism protein UlaG (beta-lactamase superfamily)
MSRPAIEPGCSVVWWGHSAATISLDGVRFVTDPLLRGHIGPLHWVGHRPAPDELAATDMVLLSHLHRDHTDLPSLRQFDAHTAVLVPRGGARVVADRVPGPVDEIGIGDSRDVGSVSVRATYAAHDGARGPRDREGVAIGYLLVGSRTVYIAGDTDMFAGMRELAESVPGQRVDVALVPVSGWGLNLGAGHLDPSRAAEAVALVGARMAIPVHWGRLRIPVLWRTRPGRYTRPAAEFAALTAVAAPTCRVVVPAPGVRVDVPEAVPA